MMRKFSKILALVLAFAMVLCPALTAAAETDVAVNGYVFTEMGEIVDGAATVTVRVETEVEINAVNFQVKFAEGVEYADAIEVAIDGYAVSSSYDADAAVLNVVALDSSDEFDNVVSELEFAIAVNVTNASNYDLYLTKIFAVGAGATESDEDVVVFAYADNAQSGVIDVEAAREAGVDYFETNICTHDFYKTDEKAPTCTEDGSSVVTCATCGIEISNTLLPATGHIYNGTIADAYVIVVEPTEGVVGYAVYNAICDNGCGTWNDAYYNEDGSLKADVDFAALVAAGDPNVVELPALEIPCDTATEYSKDETGHWYDCSCGEKHDLAPHTAGDAKEENRVEAAPGVAGSYDTVVYCSVCNYEISRTTNTIPALPVGPEEDSTLVFQGASVGYGSASLQINFRIRNTVLNKYADMELVIMPQKYDSATLNLVENVPDVVVKKADLAAAGSTMKSYLYTDIYLYELGLDINYMLKAYDANGELVAVSPVYTTSPATYLKSAFATSSDPKFRTLVTDTIIVGASSATNMAKSYADSDLAKAPSILDGFDTSEATATVDGYNTTNVFNSYNTNFKNTSSTHQFRTSVQIGKAPSITYRIKDSKAALDLSKLSFHVTYSRKDSSGATVNFDKTFSAADGSVSLISGWVNFKFDQIGLQGGNADIFTEVIYDGSVVCDSTYSVETYLGGQLSGSIGELAAALIKLGISYRAYSAK